MLKAEKKRVCELTILAATTLAATLVRSATKLIIFFEVPWLFLLTTTISALALLTSGVLTTGLILLATASWCLLAVILALTSLAQISLEIVVVLHPVICHESVLPLNVNGLDRGPTTRFPGQLRSHSELINLRAI